MCRIYTCDFCKNGNHECCEGDISPSKGAFGGSSCNCHCNLERLKNKIRWQLKREAEGEKIHLANMVKELPLQRKLTQEEAKTIAEFFWSHFKG